MGSAIFALLSFSGGTGIDDMCDDDDNGDADDSPTDSLKGKRNRESGMAGAPLEGLEVRSILTHLSAFAHSPSQTDYRPHLHLPGSIPLHLHPTVIVAGSPSSYTAQYPIPKEACEAGWRPGCGGVTHPGGLPPPPKSDPSLVTFLVRYFTPACSHHTFLFHSIRTNQDIQDDSPIIPSSSLPSLPYARPLHQPLQFVIEHCRNQSTTSKGKMKAIGILDGLLFGSDEIWSEAARCEHPLGSETSTSGRT
jgi:hypothetical protein